MQELRDALRTRGMEVETWSASDSASTMEDLPPIPGARLSRTLTNRPALEAFTTTLRATKPDVVHVHSLQGAPLRIPEVARSHGARVIWTHHDFYAICPRVHLHTGAGDRCGGPKLGAACAPCHGDGLRSIFAVPVFALRHVGFVDAMQRSHALVVPSRFVRDLLVENGAPAHRIHVLPPAVPPPARLAGLPHDARTVRFVTASDLRRAKGIDRVLRAFVTLPASGLRLDVLGGPPAPPAPREEAFEQELTALAKGHPVRFLGRYSPGSLLSHLDGAAALIVAPRVRESWGRTVNEALLAGIPVVAPRDGGIAEQVTEGVNGLLWDPDDETDLMRAMRQVVDLGIEMQAEASNWPRAWTLDRHVDQIVAIYEDR